MDQNLDRNDGELTINISLNEKVNLGNWETTGDTVGLKITVPITKDLPEKLSNIIDFVNKSIEYNDNIGKIINIIVRNKDRVLEANIKKIRDRITDYGSLRQYYQTK